MDGRITPPIVVADGEANQLVVRHRSTFVISSLGLEEADAYFPQIASSHLMSAI